MAENKNNKKWWLNSTAVTGGLIGICVFVLRFVKGWALDADETKGIFDLLMTMKVEIAGIAASAAIVLSRFKAVDFDKGLLKTKTFWSTVAKGATIVVSAFGIHVDLAHLAESLFDLITLGAATYGSIRAVYGRVNANTKLVIKKAEVIE